MPRTSAPGITKVLAILWLSLPAPLAAQYMYLDANGDGGNDQRDELSHDGWSKADVWLDTSMNRNGSPSRLVVEEQAVAGYELTLDAAPMCVEWGAYTPANPDMRIVRGPLVDSLSFYTAVECGQPLTPGRHKL